MVLQATHNGEGTNKHHDEGTNKGFHVAERTAPLRPMVASDFRLDSSSSGRETGISDFIPAGTPFARVVSAKPLFGHLSALLVCVCMALHAI
jgi:hypothetical protein